MGEPEDLNSPDWPEVKSIEIDFPSAGSAGQLPCVSGLQALYVWVKEVGMDERRKREERRTVDGAHTSSHDSEGGGKRTPTPRP